MEKTDARSRLGRADQLATRSSTTAARWYVRYLVIYGVASFGIAAAHGFTDHTPLVTAITMPLWVIIIIGLSVWAMRQRTAVHGFGVIHGTVIGVWGAAWAATIGFGTTVFAGTWQWFVAGGAVMASTAFAGAFVTHRRARQAIGAVG